MDKASALIPDVARMLPKLDSILTNLNRLSGDPALQKTLANAAEISENLKTTSAQLDRMMGREVPQMMGHLNRTAAHAEAFSGQLAQVDVKQTMAEVQGTLRNVNTMAGQMNSLLTDVNQKLNSPTNNLGAFLADRKLYDRLNSTVSHADSLMIDLKAHPKRYVHFSLFGRKSK